MDLPLNAEVHCSDGRCGRSTHLIINPTIDQVTHLVVRQKAPPRTQRLVPVSKVANSTPDIILLDCNRAEFEQLEPFYHTQFIRAEIPHFATDPALTMLWPYVVPSKVLVDETLQRVPPGELALRRGTRVRAVDGQVGRVDEFVVDPGSGDITHLILKERNLLGRREVCIPVSAIDQIEQATVYLKLDKGEVAALPRLPVRRAW